MIKGESPIERPIFSADPKSQSAPFTRIAKETMKMRIQSIGMFWCFVSCFAPIVEELFAKREIKAKAYHQRRFV